MASAMLLAWCWVMTSTAMSRNTPPLA
jgi:hypothetical protein